MFWILFFCLSLASFVCGSQSFNSSYQSSTPATVVAMLDNDDIRYMKQVKVVYRTNDPYRLYRIYRNGRPKPSHTKERIVIVYKELDKETLTSTLRAVDKLSMI